MHILFPSFNAHCACYIRAQCAEPQTLTKIVLTLLLLCLFYKFFVLYLPDPFPNGQQNRKKNTNSYRIKQKQNRSVVNKSEDMRGSFIQQTEL